MQTVQTTLAVVDLADLAIYHLLHQGTEVILELWHERKADYSSV